MREFATEKYPLRCSQLYKLLECPLSQVLQILRDEDESGEAADTGSAVHRAVAEWHQTKLSTAKAIAAMAKDVVKYPRADMEEAEKFFRLYAEDVRNREAVILDIERAVRFTLPPCETDPTKEKIVVTGMLDQVRREGKKEITYDIKTGSRFDGVTMITAHAVQLAAYQMGYYAETSRKTDGGIIRVKDYQIYKTGTKKGTAYGPVFWPVPWGFDEVEMLLAGVRTMVALVRRGIIFQSPGDHCKWCPQVSPHACGRDLRKIKLGVRL